MLPLNVAPKIFLEKTILIVASNVSQPIEKKDFLDIAFTKRMKRSKRRHIMPEAV